MGDPDASEIALLIACGERGYRTVVTTRGRAATYVDAYGAGIEHLCNQLLSAARNEPGWRPALRAGLLQLGLFVNTEPMLARGLLVEAGAAGEPVSAKRSEIFERLTAAVDSARREIETRHVPPPITAAFIVSAIEHSVIAALTKKSPKDFKATIPDLAYLAVTPFFGRQAANAERALLLRC